MRQGGSRAVPLRWILLAVLLLLTVVAAASFEEDTGREEPGRVLVGDLKLADADEPPSDGVERTFHAGNLAPGDEHARTLEILREPIEDLPSTLEPRVRIRLDADHGSTAFGKALRVSALSYGAEDLVEEAEDACGRPLTLSRLASCTRTDANPLSNLPDPTPIGRPFRLGVTFHPASGDRYQGASIGFGVRVELYAASPAPQAVRELLPDDPIELAASQQAGCPIPLDAGEHPPSPVERPLLAPSPADPSTRSVERLWPGGPQPHRLWDAWLPVGC